MPLVTLHTTSVQIPVVNPGQGASDDTSLSLTFNATEQTPSTPLSLAIINETQGGSFVAELYGSTPGVGHAASPPVLVATTGTGSGGGPNGTLVKGLFYRFTINFIPPALPVPGSFAATLVVSWQGGSANVQLGGTTAQIKATVDTAQPIKLKPGDKPTTVPIKIDYASGDAKTLRFSLAAAIFPAPLPKGLTIAPSGGESLPAAYVSTGPNPKQPSVAPGQVLEPDRTKDVTVSVSTDQSIEPSKDVVAYVKVTVPDFQQLEPASVKITFDIPPLPITISVLNEPISFKTDASAELEIKIKEAGAPTIIKFGAASAKYASNSQPVDINIKWPQDISTSTTVSATISAANTKLDGLVNVTVPFTAYNGLLKDELDFKLTLLPYTDVLNMQYTIPPGQSATGTLTLSLSSDGTATMTGALNRNESLDVPGDYLEVGIGWLLTDSTGRQFAVQHTGYFEHNWQFNKSANSSQLKQYWADFMPSFENKVTILWEDLDNPALPAEAATVILIPLPN